MIGPPMLSEPARLVVRAGSGDTIDVAAIIGGDATEQSMMGGNYQAFVAETLPRLDSLFFNGDTKQRTKERVARDLVLALLPTKVRSAISSWSSSQGGHGVLVVDAESPFDSLPWEVVPAHFGNGLFVVRDVSASAGDAGRTPGLGVPAAVLAAGWQQTATGDFLPGIASEIEALSRKFPTGANNAELEVRTLVDAEWGEVIAEARDHRSSIVHLAVASGFTATRPDSPSRLTLFPSEAKGDSPDRASAALDDVIGSLKNADDLRLIVVNTMAFPVGYDTTLLRQLSTELGVAVIGWIGMLTDEVATDFAAYWYQRAIEGMTLPEISHSFVQRSGGAQWVRGAMPIVLSPHPNWLSEPVIDTTRTRTFADSISQQVKFDPLPLEAMKTAPTEDQPIAVEPPNENDQVGSTAPPPGSISITAVESMVTVGAPQINPPQVAINWAVRRSIFPAQLINGRSPITSFSLESDRDFNGRIEVECDIGGVKSAVRRLLRFTTGSNPLMSDRLTYEFPVIYELIGSDERRVIAFTVSVYEQELIAQETIHANWLSRRDWLNDDEGWPFVGAYVLSMSGAVAQLVNTAQGILSQIGKPGDRFEGYPKNDSELTRVTTQMRAIFQAVRSLGIQYITPPGLPVAVFNPIRMSPADIDETEEIVEPFVPHNEASQIVRTPEDILTRSHGTCHDLSLLFAAAAEYVGLYPVVILMSGHTYVGYWTSRDAHQTFWRGSSAATPGTEPWTISHAQLGELVADGHIQVLEANMAAHPQASIEQAKNSAKRYVANPTNRVVDVQQSRLSGVQPIMLM